MIEGVILTMPGDALAIYQVGRYLPSHFHSSSISLHNCVTFLGLVLVVHLSYHLGWAF